MRLGRGGRRELRVRAKYGISNYFEAPEPLFEKLTPHLISILSSRISLFPTGMFFAHKRVKGDKAFVIVLVFRSATRQQIVMY